MEESIWMFSVNEILENERLISLLPDDGFVVEVGEYYAAFNDSNSGWCLLNMPNETLTLCNARSLVDDITYQNMGVEINIVSSKAYKKHAIDGFIKIKNLIDKD